MAQYIDKSILVEEIRKYIKNAEAYLKYHHNRNDKLSHSFEQEKLVMCELLSFIDTIEVKEVDLGKSARCYLLNEHKSLLNEVLHQCDLKTEMQYHQDIENAYKAGFELGLKAGKGE